MGEEKKERVCVSQDRNGIRSKEPMEANNVHCKKTGEHILSLLQEKKKDRDSETGIRIKYRYQTKYLKGPKNVNS